MGAYQPRPRMQKAACGFSGVRVGLQPPCGQCDAMSQGGDCAADALGPSASLPALRRHWERRTTGADWSAASTLLALCTEFGEGGDCATDALKSSAPLTSLAT